MSRVPRVPKCPSARVPECLSVQVLFECPSASSARVHKCPSVLSAQIPKCPLSARVPKCPWNALGVLFERPISL